MPTDRWGPDPSDPDPDDVACGTWLAGISARADHEDPGVDEQLLDAHLRRCASCRAFANQIADLRPGTRLAEAPVMPDLSRQVMKRTSFLDRANSWGAVRLLLALVAFEVLVLSIPALFFGHDHSESAHAARHLGSFSVAYAVALLVVVVRPARARAVLPVTVVLAGAIFITAVVDISQGHVPFIDETLHIPELLSVLFVWLLARTPSELTASARTATDGPPPLRAVDDDVGAG